MSLVFKIALGFVLGFVALAMLRVVLGWIWSPAFDLLRNILILCEKVLFIAKASLGLLIIFCVIVLGLASLPSGPVPEEQAFFLCLIILVTIIFTSKYALKRPPY